MKPNPLKHLRIASPCPVGWDKMTGDERVRFCCQCNLHVYNIAELTRKEATALIASTEGRICGRIYRRSDGTVITKDCPVGLRAVRRRFARAAGSVFATVVALSSAVLGQKPSQKDDGCKQQVTISRKNSNVDGGLVTGTVLDANGAFVPNAIIKITERTSKKTVETTSDSEGRFKTPALTVGVYDLAVEVPGFKTLQLPHVTVGAKETVDLSLILETNSSTVTVTVGVILLEPERLIDFSHPDRTIISGEMIRSLPKP